MHNKATTKNRSFSASISRRIHPAPHRWSDAPHRTHTSAPSARQHCFLTTPLTHLQMQHHVHHRQRQRRERVDHLVESGSWSGALHTQGGEPSRYAERAGKPAPIPQQPTAAHSAAPPTRAAAGFRQELSPSLSGALSPGFATTPTPRTASAGRTVGTHVLQ